MNKYEFITTDMLVVTITADTFEEACKIFNEKWR